jgi:hypothetical protein
MRRLLAKEMGFDDPAFQMTGSELYAERIKWDAPQTGGADVAHIKRHGFLRIDVGAPNTCAPHAQSSFPTPSGKVAFLPHEAKNFVAPPFRFPAMLRRARRRTPTFRARQRRRAGRRHCGDARFWALAQPLGRLGQLHLFGRLWRVWALADIFRQSDRGDARQLALRILRRGLSSPQNQAVA